MGNLPAFQEAVADARETANEKEWIMKMNELPDAPAGQSLQLDAKGKDVAFEYFADGEIFFWTDDGLCLEFDRKNVALLLAALRQQEKLPKTGRPLPTPGLAPSRVAGPVAVPAIRGVEADKGKSRLLNRAVAKEGNGWGATVVVDGQAQRYYYDKRDSAREASADHAIGEAGRIG